MTKKIKVAFQGDKGAYSHIASLEAFPNIEPIACATFEEAFQMAMDDAQFKMGLCYMNIGKIDEAIIEFEKLLNSYPNSEYYVRAKNYINQY